MPFSQEAHPACDLAILRASIEVHGLPNLTILPRLAAYNGKSKTKSRFCLKTNPLFIVVLWQETAWMSNKQETSWTTEGHKMPCAAEFSTPFIYFNGSGRPP